MLLLKSSFCKKTLFSENKQKLCEWSSWEEQCGKYTSKKETGATSNPVQWKHFQVFYQNHFKKSLYSLLIRRIRTSCTAVIAGATCCSSATCRILHRGQQGPAQRLREPWAQQPRSHPACSCFRGIWSCRETRYTYWLGFVDFFPPTKDDLPLPVVENRGLARSCG